MNLEQIQSRLNLVMRRDLLAIPKSGANVRYTRRKGRWLYHDSMGRSAKLPGGLPGKISDYTITTF